VLGFVVVVGGGTAFVIYDRATAIDRSSPEVTTDQFLDSVLVLRDPARISLFVCSSWSAQDALAQAKPPDDSRVAISWGDLSVQENGARATVRAKVQFSAPAGSGFFRDAQIWRLELADEDGWRVCSLAKEGSVNP
jgi:hypothetical protein